jgi:hypothetical protein
MSHWRLSPLCCIEAIVQRQKRMKPEGDNNGFFLNRQHGEFWRLGAG